MSTYHAPLADMLFVMNELAGLEQVSKLPGFEEATPDTVAAILEEASKFATNVLDPLNRTGDLEGAKWLEGGNVKTPAGFKSAYEQYCANGWNCLTKSPGYRGAGVSPNSLDPRGGKWKPPHPSLLPCPFATHKPGPAR